MTGEIIESINDPDQASARRRLSSRRSGFLKTAGVAAAIGVGIAISIHQGNNSARTAEPMGQRYEDAVVACADNGETVCKFNGYDVYLMTVSKLAVNGVLRETPAVDDNIDQEYTVYNRPDTLNDCVAVPGLEDIGAGASNSYRWCGAPIGDRQDSKNWDWELLEQKNYLPPLLPPELLNFDGTRAAATFPPPKVSLPGSPAGPRHRWS